MIEVIDDGPGIPPELLPDVFERFAKDPASPGSGLGLAIARDLVQAHGGTIEAISPAGQGTTIRVRLPRGFLRTVRRYHCAAVLRPALARVCGRGPAVAARNLVRRRRGRRPPATNAPPTMSTGVIVSPEQDEATTATIGISRNE